jgi:biotin operon repressor
MDKGDTKEEKIGFHKGALSTLSKEREELGRILNIVEQLMQMHISELKDLGVDLEEEADELDTKPKDQQEMKKDRPPIEDLL